jgi:glycerol-1-phosphate dehydrogenase [NAD(P)+]
MFYRDVSLPAIVEIGKNKAQDLGALLNKNHLYFEKLILFTQKELAELFHDFINEQAFYKVVIIQGGNFEEIDEVAYEEYFNDALFIAFGGGSVIDFVKMYATKHQNQFISMPSTLTNDAIYSPIARLTVNGVKKSHGVKSPIGIIVDTDIVKQSPELFLIAGVGDLISNLSAVKDCKLGIEALGEKIDNFSMYLSKSCVDGIMQFERKDIFTDEFIEKLSIGLILSGLSMNLSQSSRPASGSEHLISHAIDEFYPEKSTLHGLQVSWAQLMIEKHVRQDQVDYDSLYHYFEKIGLLQAFEEHIQFTELEFFDLLPLAIKTRKRYTVLDVYFNRA